ncbi:hypothetical protein LPTSP1_24620 [Leptospira johnsonii]|uniref:Uncharacterized protein n=1 Tax=Leptospira johnsonii TaxID=1917820 RepID=A0A2P2D492_9LEPT|nr:hypothetical protein LPTSP1_24620 [Leptospira johnsonii]
MSKDKTAREKRIFFMEAKLYRVVWMSREFPKLLNLEATGIVSGFELATYIR